jgi:hypothetical protein
MRDAHAHATMETVARARQTPTTNHPSASTGAALPSMDCRVMNFVKM